jgi:ADP-ribosylglycohydrolase
MNQLPLFNQMSESSSKNHLNATVDRFEGAVLFSAVGDALGWPTEFLKPDGRRNHPYDLPIRDFVQWRKVVGGKWWGYEDEIAPGQYSDDTQLMLAVARCISETGEFQPELFAYEEFPLWLHYQCGGGSSVKTAARKLIGKKASWLKNFYRVGELNYKNAGANGAAMRNLAISLANIDREPQLIKDSFFNTLISHGHPRAILGTILFGLSVRYLITTSQLSRSEMISYLRDRMENIGATVANDDRILKWIRDWEGILPATDTSFRIAFDRVRRESISYLDAIDKFSSTDHKDYYSFVGALTPETKGSGLGTVWAAIYMFLRYVDEPQEAIITAANTLGSDTDTISVFLGALLGAYHGVSAIPIHLREHIQDRDYLVKTARRLHNISTGEHENLIAQSRKLDRKEAYLRILAWEIGLHEMFWDAIEVGGIIAHPTMGRGKITHKVEKSVRQHKEYKAKLISIQFDCGQSCIFHSRVKNQLEVTESLAKEIDKAL